MKQIALYAKKASLCDMKTKSKTEGESPKNALNLAEAKINIIESKSALDEKECDSISKFFGQSAFQKNPRRIKTK